MLRIERYKRPSVEVIESALLFRSITEAPIRCEYTKEIDTSLYSRLIEAYKKGLDKEVRRLLNAGANPNTIRAIHFTVERGSLLTV